MIVLILFIGGIVAGLVPVSILVLQYFRIKKGIIVIEENYNGPSQVSVILRMFIRYALKRSVYFRKFLMQYILHIMVRLMHYLDKASSLLYARSRNWFVENAVKNRGTVPHFWNHLKVYKKEMDQEKEDSSELK